MAKRAGRRTPYSEELKVENGHILMTAHETVNRDGELVVQLRVYTKSWRSTAVVLTVEQFNEFTIKCQKLNATI